MVTKFFVALQLADPVVDLARNLGTLLGSVRIQDALLVEVNDQTAAQLLDRVLAAAGRDYLKTAEADRAPEISETRIVPPPHTDAEVAAWEAEVSAAKQIYEDWVSGRIDLPGQPADAYSGAIPMSAPIAAPVADWVNQAPPAETQIIHGVMTPIPTEPLMAPFQLDDYMPEAGEGVPALAPEPQTRNQKRAYTIRATREPVNCANCGEPFIPLRADSAYCSKPDCRRALKNKYQRAARAAKAKEQASAAEVQPADPILEARDVDLPANQPAPDPYEEQRVFVPADSLPFVPPAELPRNGRSLWTLKDGPHSGRILTTTELKEHLERGELQNNWRLDHTKLGQCRVVRFGRKNPTYGVKCLFGTLADSLIDLAVMP